MSLRTPSLPILSLAVLAFAPTAAAQEAATPAPAERAPETPAPEAPALETTPAPTNDTTEEWTPETKVEATTATTEPAEAEAEQETEPEPEPVVAEDVPDEPPPAEEPPPPSLTPLKISASLWSRFEYRQNYDKLGVSGGRFAEGDSTFYRARLGIQTNPLALDENLSASVKFVPQAAGEYGTVGTVGEQPLGLYEGFVQLQGEKSWLQLGRFAMNYGDALVIGNLEWHQSARAFEGIRYHHALDAGYVDLFVTQTTFLGAPGAEGHPTFNDPLFAGDSYFWGAYAGIGPMLKESLALDVYFLTQSVTKTRNIPTDPADPASPTFTRASANHMTVGARVADKYDSFDYRFEGGLQFGERSNPANGGDTTRTASAFHVDGELGLTAGGFRLALGGLIASGDDPTTPDEDEGWAQLYPTAHKFLGLMDVIGGRTNVSSLNAKVEGKLAASTLFKLHGHLFNRLEVPPAAPGTEEIEKFAGTELDAILVQKLGGPFALSGMYSMFLPNEAHYGASDTVHYVELQATFAY